MLKNLIPLPGTTHDYTGTTISDPSHPGSHGWDENWATYHGGAGNGNCSVYATHIFDKAYLITKVLFRLRAHAYCYADHEPWASASWFVQYWDGSAWQYFNEVSTNKKTWYGDPDVNVTVDSESKWPGHEVIVTPVLTIKVRAYCVASTGGYGNETKHTDAEIYEMQAFGQVYEDTGLRVYKPGGAVAIGGDYPANSSHHFRCYGKGNKVWGIPHLDVGDSNASKIRVYHNGVFALPKAS